MVVAAAPILPRDQTLWTAEADRVLASAADLTPAARRRVRAVLLSLADDPCTDAGAHGDVAAMLEAIELTS